MHEPDASLVRSASAGDRRAFEQLVRECQGPVRRYLRHLVGDDARADDLTQEVLVKVHAQLHAYRFESRFMTWLFRIARNAVHDDRRSEQRRRGREERAYAAPASPDPTLAGEIAAALASLPVAMREALLLVEVCGFSYAEVGQLVGVPEGTVKSRVHRAREGVVRWYAGTEVERR
jgi:RNA polymerase sigma-70 factor (ECF subfamily)